MRRASWVAVLFSGILCVRLCADTEPDKASNLEDDLKTLQGRWLEGSKSGWFFRFEGKVISFSCFMRHIKANGVPFELKETAGKRCVELAEKEHPAEVEPRIHYRFDGGLLFLTVMHKGKLQEYKLRRSP